MTSGRRSLLTAFAVATLSLPPTPAASQTRPRTIVALLAHADDETAAGPALARYAREGRATVKVPVTPADLDVAVKTMACHKTQFTAEAMQRFLPARDRVWNGGVALVPASPSLSGEDLFRR